jgi:hypothetical protein
MARAFCFSVVIARSEATKQSILSLRRKMDCFAPLAMTVKNSHAASVFSTSLIQYEVPYTIASSLKL